MHTIGGAFDGVGDNTHWVRDRRWLVDVAHDIATQRSPYYDGRKMSGASAMVFTGSRGMLRCTLGADARANTDVKADIKAANAGGEVDEDC
jgi:hypothetical protein